MSLPDLYNMMWFLKQHHKFSIQEMESLYPFEFDIFYYMGIKDTKERQEEHDRQKSKMS